MDASGGANIPQIVSTSTRVQQHAAAMDGVAIISTVDVDEIIEKNKCAQIYHQLEECLAETDRNWLKCQKEVKALRACSEDSTKNTGKTRKGYQGVKLESMWARHVVEAIATDDEELLAVAMQSSIADPTALVDGGYNGSPYSLSTYGFYTTDSFLSQAKLLQRNERELNEGREYLAAKEWEVVDANLVAIARHSNAKLASAVRGDSILMLAVRNRAFCVACKALQLPQIDPLALNEAKETLREVIHSYTSSVSDEVVNRNHQLVDMFKSVIVPSEGEEFSKLMNKLLGEFVGLHNLLLQLRAKLENRINGLITLKQAKRRADIRREEVPVEVSLELCREAVMLDHLQNYKEISDAVQDRLIKQRELLAEYDIKKRVEEQQALIKHVRGLDGTLNIDPTIVVEQPKKLAPSKEELRRRREAARALRKKHRLSRSRSSVEEGGSENARSDFGGAGVGAEEVGEAMHRQASSSEDAPLSAEAIAQANAAAAEAKLRELLIPAVPDNGPKDGLQIDEDLNSKFLVTYTFNEKGEKVMDVPMETKMAPLLRDKAMAIAYVKKQDSSEEILYR